jgi:hypothetical protein
MKRTNGNWSTIYSQDEDTETIGTSWTKAEDQEGELCNFEMLTKRNAGMDIAHCFGPDRKANAALMSVAPEMRTVISLILRNGLTKKNRARANQVLRKSQSNPFTA